MSTVPFSTEAASVPSPGGANEDLVLTGPHFALVIDGATAEPGASTGCGHDVRWLVAEVGTRLARGLLHDPDARQPLRELLHDALTDLATEHGRTCDLDNPCSPTATLALLRLTGDTVEHLVLGDSTVALREHSGAVHAVTDDRLERLIHLPWAELRRHRNRPGGFWVAGPRPEAARQALVGRHPVASLSAAALLTDGAARLVERYDCSWPDLLDLLEAEGPVQLVERVRTAELRTAPGRFPGKHQDDATAVLCRFERDDRYHRTGDHARAESGSDGRADGGETVTEPGTRTSATATDGSGRGTE
ncbi:protein phosphatase 2C domain-containing protein [Kitasatospora sp. NPDC002965]|uniref:protein phosphatase 2C domain-containing protein n=1 Tax=Kitasatospora sp. NPDC002965 TaxID=3154775 RepID=UPI0033ADD5B0